MKKNFAELASIGYPHLTGVRLRYDNGSGQIFDADQLKENPERIVEYLNDWIESQRSAFDNYSKD